MSIAFLLTVNSITCGDGKHLSMDLDDTSIGLLARAPRTSSHSTPLLWALAYAIVSAAALSAAALFTATLFAVFAAAVDNILRLPEATQGGDSGASVIPLISLASTRGNSHCTDLAPGLCTGLRFLWDRTGALLGAVAALLALSASSISWRVRGSLRRGILDNYNTMETSPSSYAVQFIWDGGVLWPLTRHKLREHAKEFSKL
ncbi:hypothetical protein EJ02DRAFT_469757 [Clathrospora elynae]|uniref:Uncharacterized protein n=1 Tax=Clathrospora elynae TaxID=706981 RepID=A0A6A5SBK4_9PLEO|nr:hypothetical protein EJ02DRAFT_469757 [Clathrospora elynae]